MDSASEVGRALQGMLDAAESASPVEAVEAVTRELAASLSATSVSFLVADLSGRALVRMTHLPLADGAGAPLDAAERAHGDRLHEGERATVLPLDGGAPEQALRTQQVQVLDPDQPYARGRAPGEWLVLAPVTERGEAIGLLELSLPVLPTAAVQRRIAHAALVLAYVVIASRRHTDLFEWGQRSTQYTLSAEIQRRLLPSALTCEAGAFTLSGWLEPAASIGGDTFDYVLSRDELHLSVTDAMGHGVTSALIASVCLGALRNSRRRGESLLQQAAAANAALLEHQAGIPGEAFATGLLVRVQLSTGVLSLVNAGHVPPYLVRTGQVDLLDLPPALPLGMFPDAEHSVTAVALQPGDRLVFVTDGMLERNAADVDLPARIAATRTLHPREATRALADEIIAASGTALADDATLFVLDWHGEHGRDRETTSGAETARTSSPLTR